MILAAAIRYHIPATGKDVVLCGARHGDVFRQLEELAFESVYRHEGRCIVTVRAQMEGPSDASMSVHFDRDTGEVQYPVEIVLTANPVSFTLDSDDMCSCTLPPAVPGDMVDGIRDTLRLFHDVVAQARKLIEEERNRLRENG